MKVSVRYSENERRLLEESTLDELLAEMVSSVHSPSFRQTLRNRATTVALEDKDSWSEKEFWGLEISLLRSTEEVKRMVEEIGTQNTVTILTHERDLASNFGLKFVAFGVDSQLSRLGDSMGIGECATDTDSHFDNLKSGGYEPNTEQEAKFESEFELGNARLMASELACVISDALEILRYEEADDSREKNAERILSSAIKSYREWSKGKQAKPEMSASEALYGFCAWLTCRDKVIRMSAVNECGPVVDAISLFCKTNNLDMPRDHWEDNLIHPKEENCKEECDDYDYRDACAVALKALGGDLNHDNVAKAKKILKNALK